MPKKYYFSDIGLRNARIKFRRLEQTHSMENVIYNELRMRGYMHAADQKFLNESAFINVMHGAAALLHHPTPRQS